VEAVVEVVRQVPDASGALPDGIHAEIVAAAVRGEDRTVAPIGVGVGAPLRVDLLEARGMQIDVAGLAILQRRRQVRPSRFIEPPAHHDVRGYLAERRRRADRQVPGEGALLFPGERLRERDVPVAAPADHALEKRLERGEHLVVQAAAALGHAGRTLAA